MSEIQGKVAFVTGGGGSIGGAIARALAAEGASVAVADILQDNAQKVADQITEAGGTAIGVECDVTDRDAIRRAKAEVNGTLGHVSMVQAIAGTTSWQRLDEMTDADIDWLYQLNLMGVVNCMQIFVPDMVEAREGHLLGVASVAGLSPGWVPFHTVYSSAKLAVVALMMNLRLELEEHGVGSSVLLPSGVVTRAGEHIARMRPDQFGEPGYETDLKFPDAVKDLYAEVNYEFRPADEVGQMVVLAVRENRPIVITSQQDRDVFQDTYVAPMMQAFDDVTAFDQSLGDKAGPRLTLEQMKAAWKK